MVLKYTCSSVTTGMFHYQFFQKGCIQPNQFNKEMKETLAITHSANLMCSR
jgi:hypothetical protein